MKTNMQNKKCSGKKFIAIHVTINKKNVACDILAPSAVAFMQHIPIARVRILSEAFLFHRKCGAISYETKNSGVYFRCFL